jgi:3-oxoacyl-[acyl-carrier protein] reductase
MTKILNDNVAIVTGGGRGIGFAIVTDFVNEGADVIALDKIFPEDFEAKADVLRATGRKVIGKTVDITNTNETQKVCEEIANEFGRIDILVNNAGITRDRALFKMTEEDWDAVLAVNLKGAFNTMKVVTRFMAKQRKGKIINISSVVGLIGNFGQANYSASKAGLIGLSKTIAKEFASRNINVNCIAPGFVETDMTAKLNDEQRNAFLNVIPLKRATNPEEIAGVVTFLASKKADYITGQVIAVDGGMVMS